jgi:hypothetical protein
MAVSDYFVVTVPVPKKFKKNLAGTKQIYAAHVDFVWIAVGAEKSTGRQSSSALSMWGMLEDTV